MLSYAERPSERRTDLLFRGQPDAQLAIISTLDRQRKFGSDHLRELAVTRLLREFRSQLIALAEDQRNIPEDEALEILGRHHGLPSPLIDWTQSPWIAAYFAWQDAEPPTTHVAVWRLDRTRVTQFGNEVDLVDEEALFRYNKRALMQRSVLLRVNSVRKPLRTLLASALMVYKIPMSDRAVALADLDEMGINGTRLFADVEGAAKTAWSRFSSESDE